MYLYRELEKTLEEALRKMPVVAITGMRQTGKTTILRNAPSLENRFYISLDDMAMLKAARAGDSLWDDDDEFVTIDEAQRAPELFLAIKQSVDNDRRKGRFLLSGSASFDLRRSVAESLVGRAVYFNLLPLSRREISGKTSKAPFIIRFMADQKLPRAESARISEHEVLTGGLPQVVLDPGSAEMWFKGYEQNYVERDIRLIARVENIIGFRDLLRLAAMRTAQVLNINSLARDAGLPVKTTHRYLGWIEESFIIRRIQPFLKNRATQVKKAPKLLVSDSGLACFLSGVRDLKETPLKGAFIETYVAQNLLGILSAHDFSAELLYWRTQSGNEVDFVISSNNKVMAIEVKAAATWSSSDLKGLRSFLSVTPNCKAAVLAYNGDKPARIDDRLWAIPLGTLLS